MSEGTIKLHLSAKCTLAAYNCVLAHLQALGLCYRNCALYYRNNLQPANNGICGPGHRISSWHLAADGAKQGGVRPATSIWSPITPR